MLHGVQGVECSSKEACPLLECESPDKTLRAKLDTSFYSPWLTFTENNKERKLLMSLKLGNELKSATKIEFSSNFYELRMLTSEGKRFIFDLSTAEVLPEELPPLHVLDETIIVTQNVDKSATSLSSEKRSGKKNENSTAQQINTDDQKQKTDKESNCSETQERKQVGHEKGWNQVVESTVQSKVNEAMSTGSDVNKDNVTAQLIQEMGLKIGIHLLNLYMSMKNLNPE